MNRKQVLIILIPSFVFVFLWIIFNIYHGIVTSTISESLDMQIAPISPNFDTKTVQKLKQRINVTPIYQFNGTQVLQTPQTPTPSIATGSAINSSSGGKLLQ